ncbi:ATP-dependent RNA helicase HrpA [Motilimonas sp. KMU-193]|uniref:ATP-dependent RNA helicase HrpA n=1 Tax=Motilimonas sp. KMU-193 TaxID=3388668 RepID=UPI00396B2431
MSDAVIALKQRISLCLKKDQFRFLRRIEGALKKGANKSTENILAKIGQEIEKSIAIRQWRADHLPKVTYPESLPVTQKREDIANAIRDNQVVIIAGETGSGKTTQIPKICLELGRGVDGLIGHTQPRRLAARSVASRIAEELDSELGQTVGYRVRFTDQLSDESYIKLMTDGILLAEIQSDRFLNQYDTIIIDEAHERSLNIDFILGYLKRLLPKRPDLKVIITSATIDPDRFAKHFNDAPIIEVSGRTFPVEIRYRPLEETDSSDQIDGIISAVEELGRESNGDILVFLNGEREIRDTADALQKRDFRHTEILPLFARLSAVEQNRIFAPHRGRRIILSTNVAETSLTVPGIKYVIDPGTARISRYSYRTKVQRLPIEDISQASANQRSGRCGRVSEGICIRLYSEDDYNGRSEFTDPEILRTNLASVILQMLALGFGEIQKFPFLQAPDARNINDGMKLLEELGAVDLTQRDPRKRLTKIGEQLAKLPVDPRLARMILAAQDFNCVNEVMVISAALSIQDPRERPLDKQQASDEMHRRFHDKDSDFLTFLNLWQYIKEQQKALSGSQFSKMCKKEYLAYMRVREWQDIYTQIRQVIKELGIGINSTPADYDAIHCSLVSGMLSHVGFKDKEQEYLGARNSKFYLFPGSGLYKKQPKWLMVAELVETSKLFGRIGARIKPEWLELLAQHLIKRSYSEPHWSKKSNAVMALEKQSLYGIPVVLNRKVLYSDIDPKVCRELFIRSALVEGEFDTKFAFFKQNQSLRQIIEELEHKSRRRDILVDDQVLFDFYDQKLPEEIVSGEHFNTWWRKQSKRLPEYLNFEREQMMAHDAEHVTGNAYPDFWQQGSFKLKLDYHFEPGAIDDGITVNVPLAIINQLEDTGFDWLIPALREELVVSLIKSLPKSLRRNFVPAPNYASAALANMSPEDGSLIDSLAKQLLRMTGVRVEHDQWDLQTLPEHLRMKFKVLNKNGKVLAQGKVLSELQVQLQGEVQQALSTVADKGIEKTGIVEWDFGELQQEFVKDHGGYEVKAFPALVDKRSSVAIELFDSPARAELANRQGMRRLMLLNVPSPIKYLQKSLPNKAKLALYFTPFGQVKDLIDDCIAAAVDVLLAQHALPSNQNEFDQARDHVRANLDQQTLAIANVVERILTCANGVNKKLKGKVGLDMIMAHGDIKSQLQGLVYKGFVSDIGFSKLPDVERYLKALERRLEKLPVDPIRDRQHTLEMEGLLSQYQAILTKLPKGQALPEQVIELRWLLEELRVSLFAQQLGTAVPVSVKRVKNLIAEINNSLR